MVSFVDVVKGQAVSLANLGYKKITGQLAGVVGSALNRAQPTDNPSLRPKLDPKMFTFPLQIFLPTPTSYSYELGRITYNIP